MVANLHLTTCIGSSRGIQIQPAHPQNLSAFGFVYNGLLCHPKVIGEKIVNETNIIKIDIEGDKCRHVGEYVKIWKDMPLSFFMEYLK